MSDRLPRDREKALEAIATGKYTGRTATSAHPLCVCGKWKRSYSTHDWIFRDVDPATGMPGSMVWGWVERSENYWPDECPMHRTSSRAKDAV